MRYHGIYDSKLEQYKTPWGAVPSGSSVHLTLRPPVEWGFQTALLSARFESDNHRTVENYMVRTPEGDAFYYTLDVGDYVGLVWYQFILRRPDGSGETSDLYQLTVYNNDEAVPTWFGEGFTYQIFPDRFCRLTVPDPTGMVGGRTVHQNCMEEPVFRPNEQGEIRNRDFFGGSLQGVISKLDYLRSLGVETLYFNPIFEAAENHRYGTGDYEKIDPMLGTNEDFTQLCEEAHKRGMRVMLDGVFNHVGYVSKYFNGTGEYGDGGASRRTDSPYYHWFNFQHWPDRYDSWWGIYSLPAVEERNPDYVNYITGPEGIVRRWLRAGADGWRLDVADELPDEFVHAIHEAARAEKPDAVVIGEVWEDGSNKIAYGKRRKHILGGHCDGLMNYPLRNALVSWLLGGNAQDFQAVMETIRENYPPFAFQSAMNSLGTHDTPRILTLLGTGGAGSDASKEVKSGHRLSPEQRMLGIARLKLGFLILFAFPGSPTIYYGDEAGMEGWEDPFNRRIYPWGWEDTALRDYVAALGALRREQIPLRRGELRYVVAQEQLLAFTRSAGDSTILAAANNSWDEKSFEIQAFSCKPLLGNATIHGGDGTLTVTLPPMGGLLAQI